MAHASSTEREPHFGNRSINKYVHQRRVLQLTAMTVGKAAKNNSSNHSHPRSHLLHDSFPSTDADRYPRKKGDGQNQQQANVNLMITCYTALDVHSQSTYE
ncbi:hypothetical protein MLD38_031105 [Melastoma candidum]|uniref:Uncharacterized protein n=1 Tax=Melastoma candidum TaxID=119954 RepID=A0ACB9MNQ4_9MYRT|nr:hypothetical protein MLD38_031105 [Melastoma candidum]